MKEIAAEEKKEKNEEKKQAIQLEIKEEKDDNEGNEAEQSSAEIQQIQASTLQINSNFKKCFQATLGKFMQNPSKHHALKFLDVISGFGSQFD